MDIRDDDGFLPEEAGPTDPLLSLQDLTGQRTLVWSHDQIAVREKIETGPEIMGYFVVKDRCDGRHTRNSVICSLEKLLQLVEYSFVSLGEGIWVKHRLPPVSAYLRKTLNKNVTLPPPRVNVLFWSENIL